MRGESLIKVHRALISVSDKQGLVSFAKGLEELGVEIIATSGTAGELAAAGIRVRSVEEVFDSPELAGGRVKTLHPDLFAAILAPGSELGEDGGEHQKPLAPIDLVIVNFYPFAQVARSVTPSVSKEQELSEDAVEAIDIGGPAMARAAAKNWSRVAVLVEPAQYEPVLDELTNNNGALSRETRRNLAANVFRHCARYDREIGRWLAAEVVSLPASIGIGLTKVADLRYGENPHQRAALYVEGSDPDAGLAGYRQLAGVPLSYTNFLDLDAAHGIAMEYEEPACTIIKHCNPCGVGRGGSVAEAYERALATDPRSAFGGIIGLNRPVEPELASTIASRFYDLVFAPAFDREALDILKEKKRLRVMTSLSPGTSARTFDLRSIEGGVLVQEADRVSDDVTEWRVVTRRAPTDEELDALSFAWRVVRHVRSNAVVISNSVQTLGIGAGQMSRVEPVELAIKKAAFAGLNLVGAVMASDGFFPFPDSIEMAAAAQISAVVQPGGSRRDKEVIAAADEFGIAMVFTGVRHFKH
ncbi:hypothetical protein AMJ39_04835 [candidate division TA06 bacterium DG_24]|uniref:Bifunctional purine biosynthesis protein PurH n=2 Tax=Bacteria division TA06 TaxID=1156500 RepID=A0A0S8G6R1_UNCT6|nr:MAG: hypothetical protein AMJ39_04835 [candidate division TA06 bacterium DG_24]KPK68787.1 MAG: hypothetical protein AMJ82_07360 [candidate division TA06 bacterium SM23_40]